MSVTTEARPADRDRPAARSRPRHAAPRDWWGWISHLVLAGVTYVPLLVTAPGQVAADTKQYLYLDPGQLLSRASSMWDPSTGMGTVTHQTIGYLFPMGPWYWVMQQLGLPDWVAQRLWLGTIMFLAGAGVLFLLRTLGQRGVGPLVAALAYGLSPYVLDYGGRISVILLPYAGLGWMVGLTVRALRRGGWRDPALFALVALAVGGVNATALLYAGLAPALWVPFAVWAAHEVSLRRALATVARILVLTAGVSLWWIAGLWAQAAYGLPVLSFTETIDTVAKTSLASETLRGLGYWFFYGRDKLGPWIAAGVPYTQNLALIVAGFGLSALAFLGAVVTRWRHRAYFVLLVLVGTVIAVGAHPYDDPSPLGRLFKTAATGSTAGLAMRSTARAVPLVALGLAVLLGMAVAALLARARVAGIAAAVVAAGLVAGTIPPLWQGTIVDANLRRPEHVPAYWPAAARWLDAHDDGTRVLELPGADFAAYRWGNTVDPVLPGLMRRPDVARELIPYGEAGSADLLIALDRRVQEGLLEPAALAPVARLMGVGDVVYRADLQYERYNTPRPRPTWQLLTAPRPPGLQAPVTFGAAAPSVPVRFPMLDELALGTPNGAPDPAPVSVFPVEGRVPIIRAEGAARPLVVAGDGDGLVDLGAVGLLDRRGPVLYSATFAGRPDELRRVGAGADLVLTDTNRRRAERWGSVRENRGYTERAGERPLAKDSKDARLDVFPDASDANRTVTEQRGVARVQATSYGNTVSYTPEDRAANAFDDDPLTAWRASAFGSPVGQRLEIDLAGPVTTDHITLLQPITGPRNRYITRATLRFDRGAPVTVDLGPASRQQPGQVVPIGPRTFQRVTLTIDRDNGGIRSTYVGLSPVGVAEVGIAGHRVDEVVRLPTDLLDAFGPSSASHRLAVVLTRLRSYPVPPRSDEEPALSRTFSLPTARAFQLSASARINPTTPDEGIDSVLGLPGGGSGNLGGIVARSSGRLPADLDARASSAIDDDVTTAWQPAFGPSDGQWLQVEVPQPLAFDHLDLRVVADGRHSVPTRLRVETDEGGAADVALPPVADARTEGAVTPMTVRFPAMRGRRVRVTVTATRQERTLDYYSEAPTVLPVAIAELGLPGVVAPRVARAVPAACRPDLLTIDGRPVPLLINGDYRAKTLSVSTCDGAPVVLGPGRHDVRAAPGKATGLDLDRLVLDSAPTSSAATPAVTASLTVRKQGRTSADVHVDGAQGPFWLVLGQSLSKGWTAHVRGGPSLGPPVLVDGYANGWLVQPTAASFDVHLDWTPQHKVRLALWLSAVAVLVCIALALVDRRRLPLPGSRNEPPTLALPIGPRPRPRWLAFVAAPALAFGSMSAVAGLPAGALAAGVVLAVLALPWVRAPVAFGAAALVLAAGIVTAVQQGQHHYPPEFEWPTFFPSAHTLGWLAVALLVADAVVEWLRRRARASAPDGEGPPPPVAPTSPEPSPPT